MRKYVVAFSFCNLRCRHLDSCVNMGVFNLNSNQFLTGFSQRGFVQYISAKLSHIWTQIEPSFLETVVKIVLEVQQGVEQQYYDVLMTCQVCSSDFSNAKITFSLTNTQTYPTLSSIQNTKFKTLKAIPH